MTSRIVVTGGAGYIGSHISVDLLERGFDVLIIDDFSNSSPIAIDRIAELSGRTPEFARLDLASPADYPKVLKVISDFGANGAIHLAGLKAVGESVCDPMRYYRTNINATLTLIDALAAVNATMLVFSSSATVYGERNESPVREDGATAPANPYGQTKLIIERILKDYAAAHPDWRVANLRYFNPVGAHSSGRIGEDPNGVPNNLFPYIAQVAIGRRDKLSVFGDDYPTADGTGVRDYIHVCDLSAGHIAAIEYLSAQTSGCAIDINLGTGKGYSVLEAIRAFEDVSGRKVAYQIAPRRKGDIAEIYADAKLAEALLGWSTRKSLADMCADHWRWQETNPKGYNS